jgi:hypothetical protein
MEGWSVNSGKNKQGQSCGKACLTTDGAYRGRSLCLERVDNECFAITADGWRVPVKPGGVYLVRAMAKVLGHTGFIWAGVEDAQGNGLGDMTWKLLAPAEYFAGNGLALDGPRLPDGGAAYAPMSAVFEIPAKAAWLNLSLSGWNYFYSPSNKVYLDNVALYRLR